MFVSSPCACFLHWLLCYYWISSVKRTCSSEKMVAKSTILFQRSTIMFFWFPFYFHWKHALFPELSMVFSALGTTVLLLFSWVSEYWSCLFPFTDHAQETNCIQEALNIGTHYYYWLLAYLSYQDSPGALCMTFIVVLASHERLIRMYSMGFA